MDKQVKKDMRQPNSFQEQDPSNSSSAEQNEDKDMRQPNSFQEQDLNHTILENSLPKDSK